MKKVVAIILCLIMALASIAALAETEPTVPATLAELGTLPEANADEFAVLLTKDDGKTITVTLSKAVDSIKANWLGYNEEPEELTVSPDLTTQVSKAGHKYSLGTKWVSGEHPVKKWYVDGYYFDDDKDLKKSQARAANIEVPEEEKEWAADYFEAVAADKDVPDFNEVEKIETVVEVEPAKWYVSFYNNGEYYYRTFPGDVSESDVKEFVDQFNGVYYVDDEGNTYKTEPYYEKYGYAYKVIEAHDFKPSNGSPNYAYLTKQGDAMVVYGRAGNVRYFERTVDGSNYFGLGKGKATVTFQKGKKRWYIEKIREEYETGDLQSVTAVYYSTGKLRKTIVEKREAE